MLSLKIIENKNFVLETWIELKNKQNSLFFAFENQFLYNNINFIHKSKKTKHEIYTLSYMLSHEIVKYLSSKISGGLFETENIHLSEPKINDLLSIDILVENEDGIHSNARFYGNNDVILELKKIILEKTVQSAIPKLTGYKSLARIIDLNKKYEVKILDTIRILRDRTQFLKCTFLVENTPIHFYFDKEIILYFCSYIIKNISLFNQNIFENIQINENEISPEINPILGKIFSQLLSQILNSHFQTFFKLIKSEVIFIKEIDFLEFNLAPLDEKNSNQKTTTSFEFFIENKNTSFIYKLLRSANFIEDSSSYSQKKENFPLLNKIQFPFSLEVGVTYVNESEFKNISEGDIILFDKTHLSTNNLEKNHCVINLNGTNFVSELNDHFCKITDVTKDW
jgi:hypothetical protein